MATDITAFYDAKWLAWRDMEHYAPAPRYLRRRVRHELSTMPFRSLLDVGCGEGSLLAEIHRYRPDAALAGCDLSALALDFAAARVPTAELFRLNILTDPITIFAYDVVTCVQVLEHVDDDVLALQQMRKLCRQALILSVPSGPLGEHARRNGHLRHYTLTDLIETLSRAGFRVVRGYRCGWPVHSLYRQVVRRLPEATVRSIGLGSYSPLKRAGMALLDLAYRANMNGYGTELIAMAVPR